jgi:hypothetical protein
MSIHQGKQAVPCNASTTMLDEGKEKLCMIQDTLSDLFMKVTILDMLSCVVH